MEYLSVLHATFITRNIRYPGCPLPGTPITRCVRYPDRLVPYMSAAPPREGLPWTSATRNANYPIHPCTVGSPLCGLQREQPYHFTVVAIHYTNKMVSVKILTFLKWYEELSPRRGRLNSWRVNSSWLYILASSICAVFRIMDPCGGGGGEPLLPGLT